MSYLNRMSYANVLPTWFIQDKLKNRMSYVYVPTTNFPSIIKMYQLPT